MPQVGDLTIYQEHGICRIDDICDKTYGGKTREYYVLRPIENGQDLTINLPVESKKKMLLKLMDRNEAEAVLKSFHSEGVEWIDQNSQRKQQYTKQINSGDRLEIAKVVNTLLRKKNKVEANGKKFYKNDEEMLQSIQSILFKEMALALDTTEAAVQKKINNIIAKSS
jgi:CarD family transcriptional regulator